MSLKEQVNKRARELEKIDTIKLIARILELEFSMPVTVKIGPGSSLPLQYIPQPGSVTASWPGPLWSKSPVAAGDV